MPEQTVLLQQPIRLQAKSRQEQLQCFIEQTRRRDAVEQISESTNRRLGLARHLEIQLGGKAYRTQHAHRILAITFIGVANQLQPSRAYILRAAGKVPQRKVIHAVVKRIGGEVAAPYIGLDRTVDVVAQQPSGFIDRPVCRVQVSRNVGIAVGIFFLTLALRGGRGAKRRDLDDLIAKVHVREPEAPPDQTAIAKEPAHLLGQCIGRDVEILRFDTQQQIAHRAAHQESLVPRLLESVQYFQGIWRDLVARNRMLGSGDDYVRMRGGIVQTRVFRLSPKNWPVYYQPAHLRVGRDLVHALAPRLPSSRGLGHGPLKAVTRVRIP